MKHPSEGELALFAGGDLGAMAQWWTGAHVARCPECAREVVSFREVSEELRQEALEPPSGLHWPRLAEEMWANIRLGVDAGEVVAVPAPRRDPLDWRAAMALGALTVVIVSGWWLYVPRLQPKLPDPGVTVAVRGDGVELREGAGMMLLMHPKSTEPGDVTFSVDTEGTARAWYVDEQSGQVTINNVYAE